MKNNLVDAKRALGFSFTFFAYAAWLVWDYWQTKRRLVNDTRAKLILDNAIEKRDEMILGETTNAEHRPSAD